MVYMAYRSPLQQDLENHVQPTGIFAVSRTHLISTRAVAGSSTIYDDIKDTLFEVIMDKLWYQSNGMLYFCGNTLFLHPIDGRASSKGLDHKSI